jgi:hypothetical protein
MRDNPKRIFCVAQFEVHFQALERAAEALCQRHSYLWIIYAPSRVTSEGARLIHLSRVNLLADYHGVLCLSVCLLRFRTWSK